MKTIVTVLLGFALVAAQAQTVVNAVGRYGIGDDGMAVLHYEQVAIQRGRFIPIDVFNVDFGKPGVYRESYVGLGGQLVKSKRLVATDEKSRRLVVTAEAYFGQTTGPASKGASYVLPWIRTDIRWSKRFTTDAVGFAYLPLNEQAKLHWVIDRARLNYDTTKWLRFGMGWAQSKTPDAPLAKKPFVGPTFKTKFGNVELWAQHIPGKYIAQIRWYKTFHLRRE